jgi:hypothetical protein
MQTQWLGHLLAGTLRERLAQLLILAREAIGARAERRRVLVSKRVAHRSDEPSAVVARAPWPGGAIGYQPYVFADEPASGNDEP